MSDTYNKLQYGNNYNHWNISDLVLDLNYFSFSNPNPAITRHTYLNTKPYAPIITFLNAFDMLNNTLCMCTWREVRNIAWHRHGMKQNWLPPFLCVVLELAKICAASIRRYTTTIKQPWKALLIQTYYGSEPIQKLCYYCVVAGRAKFILVFMRFCVRS